MNRKPLNHRPLNDVMNDSHGDFKIAVASRPRLRQMLALAALACSVVALSLATPASAQHELFGVVPALARSRTRLPPAI